MPHQLEVLERATSRYRDGWSHLDQWRHLMTVKTLASRVVKTPERYDDPTISLQTLILPKRVTGPEAKRLKRAIVHTMTESSCQHEYDCCGCVSTHARVVAASPRRVTVRLSASPNY